MMVWMQVKREPNNVFSIAFDDDYSMQADGRPELAAWYGGTLRSSVS